MIPSAIIRASALGTGLFLVYVNPGFLGGMTPFAALTLAALVALDVFTGALTRLEVSGPVG